MLRRLTYDAGLRHQPSLSPDGKLIAYSSDRAGNGDLDIWVQQIAGGEPVRLTTDPADDQDPAFSPDGSRIVFSSARDGGGIYVMSALGGTEQKIANRGFLPRFSPDGKWIAYCTGDRHLAVVYSVNTVHIIPAGGGSPRPVGAELFNAAAPVWSPDSHFLLLAGRSRARQSFDWWLVRADTGGLIRTPLVEQLKRHKLMPAQVDIGTQHLLPLPNAWTDDHIILSGGLGQTPSIWRLRYSMSNPDLLEAPERLTPGTGSESDASLVAPGSGSLLAFSSLLENIDLWSLPLDPNAVRSTGPMQQLTRSLGADVRQSITLDGRYLVYNSDPAGNWDVMFKDLTTGAERVLANSEVDEENPRINSDGSQVLFRVGREIFAMPSTGGLRRRVTECSVTFPFATNANTFLCLSQSVLKLVDIDTGESRTITEFSPTAPRPSWDDQWVTFYRNLNAGFTQVVVAPVLADRAARQSDVSPITDGNSWDAIPEFSPDGKLIYFLSERDGKRCLWAQRVDGVSKKPV